MYCSSSFASPAHGAEPVAVGVVGGPADCVGVHGVEHARDHDVVDGEGEDLGTWWWSLLRAYLG